MLSCEILSSSFDMNLVQGPDNDRDSPAGLMLAPVVPYSSKVQQRIRATAVLGKRPHTHWAAPLDREQGRARSLHSEGLPAGVLSVLATMLNAVASACPRVAAGRSGGDLR